MKLLPCLGCCNSPESLFVQGFLKTKKGVYLAKYPIISPEIITKKEFKSKMRTEKQRAKKINISIHQNNSKETEKKKIREKKNKQTTIYFHFHLLQYSSCIHKCSLKDLATIYWINLIKMLLQMSYQFLGRSRNVLCALNTDFSPTNPNLPYTHLLQ